MKIKKNRNVRMFKRRLDEGLAIKNSLVTILLNKKAVALEFLFWLILGVVVLVIAVFIIIILTGKGQSAIEFIKDLFKLSFIIAMPSTRQFKRYFA
ncbi:MAG: hypothetical protein AABX77_02875 [Nanoarchaeota archaeon]